jgi:hypothetical protein
MRRWRERAEVQFDTLTSALDGGERGKSPRHQWDEKVQGEMEVREMKERRK